MIKLKALLEQAKAKQQIYKTEPIKGTFLANYVTPSTAWRQELDPIIKAIQELVKKNYRLDQIKVVIRSGASKANATNRYKGKNPPLHNFVKYGEQKGGLLPPIGWVKSGTPDYKIIKAGNKFLAAERGRRLKDKIDPVLKQLFPKMPANFVMIDPKENSEQFASYQLQYAGTPQPVVEPWWKHVELIDRGGGDQFQIFDKQNTNGELVTFNYQLLPKASGNKVRVGTDSRSTFSAADYGAGPGIGVYLSKDMIRNYANKSGKGQSWMWSYGGDPADLELAALNNHKFALANPNNDRIASVYKDASLFTSSDIGPKSIGGNWTYINPSDGKLKIKRPIKV